MTNSQPPSEPELSGWKMIASHLGVSVREAQSWEKDEGMPVRRMPGRKSRVWADRAALDHWKQHVSVGGKQPPPQPALESGDRRHPRFPSRRWILGSLATAGVAAVSGAAWMIARSASRGPVRVEQIGRALCAWDDMGHLLWRRPFPLGLVDASSNGIHAYPVRNIQIMNMGGTGASRVIFAATLSDSPGDPTAISRDELYCLTADGKILWTYKPDVSVTFGDQQFSGPWDISDILVEPGSGPPIVWAALSHRMWRPGVLLAIDGAGKATVKFVNAGNLYRIGLAPEGHILVGGVNNEYDSAALAVLRKDAPASCSPQTRGTRFECVSGPGGSPERYFLLPPTELNVAADKPYNRVVAINSIGGQTVVTTEEVGEVARPPLATAMYGFSAGMAIQDVAFDDNFAVQHHYFEGAGKLDHPLSRCSSLNSPRPVRRWEPNSGWTTLAVPLKNGVGPNSHRK